MTFINGKGLSLASFSLVLALSLLLSSSIAFSAAEKPLQPVVITHPSFHQNQILLRTLRAIFGMRLHGWPDGHEITVYVLADGQLHDEFCQSVLKIQPYRLQRNWDRLLYSGTGQLPIFVSSEKEMKLKVAATPGGIGYLSRENLDDSVIIVHVQK